MIHSALLVSLCLPLRSDRIDRPASTAMAIGDSRWPRSKLEVKRCRFVGWEPSAVVSLSVGGVEREDEGSHRHCLLVLRRDGTAELYNTDNPTQWTLVSRLPGREGASASSCCLIRGIGSRHVAILASLTGSLLVWDIGTGRSKAIDSGWGDRGEWVVIVIIFLPLSLSCKSWSTRLDVRASAGGGPVWCVAPHRSEPVFAAACDDGALRLFSVQGVMQSADGLDDSISITFVRRLPNPARCRALTASWSPDCLGIAVGCSDGCVRVFRKVAKSETWLEDWRASVSGKQVWSD